MPRFFYLAKRLATDGPARSASRMRLDSRWLQLTLGLIIVMSGVGYLAQVNSLATKGYEIRQLEDSIRTLEQESAELELQVHELQSISRVEEKIKQGEFIAVANAEFLGAAPVAMAR